MPVLSVCPHAVVKLDNVVADEPDQIGKVRGGSAVTDEAQHRFIADLWNIALCHMNEKMYQTEKKKTGCHA